jgi:hypothetical protein
LIRSLHERNAVVAEARVMTDKPVTNEDKRRARIERLERELAAHLKDEQVMKRARTIIRELVELETVEAKKRA